MERCWGIIAVGLGLQLCEHWDELAGALGLTDKAEDDLEPVNDYHERQREVLEELDKCP